MCTRLDAITVKFIRSICPRLKFDTQNRRNLFLWWSELPQKEESAAEGGSRVNRLVSSKRSWISRRYFGKHWGNKKTNKQTKKWDIINVIYPKAHLTVIIAHILLHWWSSFILIWEAGKDPQWAKSKLVTLLGRPLVSFSHSSFKFWSHAEKTVLSLGERWLAWPLYKSVERGAASVISPWTIKGTILNS